MRRSARTPIALALSVLATTAHAQPANDDCASATVLSPGSLPFIEMLDTSTATNDGDASAGASACANFANSIWYRYTAGASDEIIVLDAWEGSTYEYSAIEVYTGTCGALTGTGGGPIDVDDAENWAQRVPAGTSVLLCVSDQSSSPGGGPIQVRIFEAPEFEVDPQGYLAETDRRAVAGGPGAKFFVTWSGYDGGSYEHRGRLFHASGTPLGPQLVLGEGNHFWQDATNLGSNGFVAVWADFPGVVAQRISAAGLAVGSPIVVNETSGYAGVRVDADAGANFVVAWEGAFRLFDSTGTALGGEQSGPWSYWMDVARDAAGNFVVVWESGDSVQAQRFDATGATVGSQIVVSPGYSYQPSVAAAPTGEFLVVWEEDYNYPNAIVGQAFDAAGAPDGPTVEISKPGSEYTNHRAQVEGDASGNFVVVWEDDGGRTDYSFLQIDATARRMGPGGTFLGPELTISTVNYGRQYRPAVGVAPGGEFMIAWGDSSGYQPWSVPFSEVVVARGFAADGGPPPPPPTFDCPTTAQTTCRTTILPGKSKLLVRNDGTDPEDLVINWKLVKGDATAAADFGDPVNIDDVFFCLYNETSGSAGGALVTEAALPAGGTCGGKPCWKGLGSPAGAKGFKYKDTERTPNGVLKAVLKPGDAGKTKVVLKAGRGNLAAGPAGGPPSIPIAGSLTAQLHVPATGQCWSATFDAATAKRNSGDIFQASGD